MAAVSATSFQHYGTGDGYFSFIVQDDTVTNFVSKNEKKETVAGDQVEIFLGPTIKRRPIIALKWMRPARLFRAECTAQQPGGAHVRLINWIGPHMAEPNFHVPASFGLLVLEYPSLG
ncbi:MAG: hypothetical protein ABI813_01430 [Bacteroidota bacterium]